MEDILKDIFLCLSSQTTNSQPANLFYGKTGKSIFFYCYARYVKNMTIQAIGNTLLDEVSDQMSTLNTLCFDKGVAGVGYALEWLSKNEFIQINTDEILQEIDDGLYKAVVYKKSPNISLTNGTIGRGLYFLGRANSENFNTHRFRTIMHKECVILLIDEIKDILNKDNTPIYLSKNLSELSAALMFISKMVELNIYPEISEKVLFKLIEFSDQIMELEVSQNNPKERVMELMGIAYAYWFAGKKYAFIHWQNKGTRNFNILFDQAYKTVNNETFSLNLLNGDLRIVQMLNRFFYETKDILFERRFKKLIKDFSIEKFMTKKETYSYNLIEGIVGLGLVLLSASSPQFMNWDSMILLS